MQNRAVPAGQKWLSVVGVDLPETEVMRIRTFLDSTGIDELVYTECPGGLDSALSHLAIVEKSSIVGSEGAGRMLRRRGVSPTPQELLENSPAIYYCEASRVSGDGAESLKAVILDCAQKVRSDENPLMVTRREDFAELSAQLAHQEDTGRLWRGDKQVPSPSRALGFKHDDYVFADSLLDTLLENSIHFLTGPKVQEFGEWRVAPKRGIILEGEPGNGKTVLTRALASRCIDAGINVVMFDVAALSFGRSRRFDGPEDLGEALQLAASRAPVLIVLDDLDLHCGKRSGFSENDAEVARRQTVLAHLIEFLDGFTNNDGYVLVATTNAIEDLDKALVRPGRLDIHLRVEPPTTNVRRSVLDKALRTPKTGVPDLSLADTWFEGASFAQIAELVRRYKIEIISKHGTIKVDNDVFGSTVRDYARELRFIE